jgi:hypothetical protein
VIAIVYFVSIGDINQALGVIALYLGANVTEKFAK